MDTLSEIGIAMKTLGIGLCLFLVPFCVFSYQQNRVDRIAQKILSDPEQYVTANGDVTYGHVTGTYAETDEVKVVNVQTTFLFVPITSQATDFNKSKIVGKWVGKKSKQFIKGFIEGVKNE